jgi:Putative auto-transporter adhesin, head GIN domain
MKKYILLFSIVLLFTHCEKPFDCVKSSGSIKSKVFEGFTFTKLLVNKRINVVLIEGSDHKVEVKTGENLINDIEVSVEGDLLKLTDNTSCNWVRDYGDTVVYVTAPNITQINSKTEQNITSEGVLHYPNLHLLSTNENDGYSGVGTGDFYLTVDNESVTVDNNDLGRFFITGNTTTLNVHFWENGGIFHGENLYANTVNFYHRGSNDLFIRPTNFLNGDIYNVGDVNCYSRPPAENVHVTEHYRGSLLYR